MKTIAVVCPRCDKKVTAAPLVSRNMPNHWPEMNKGRGPLCVRSVRPLPAAVLAAFHNAGKP